jgi:holin-like protein
MPDSALPTPPGEPAATQRLSQLAALAAQVGLLSLFFALWLGVGRLWRLPFPAGLLAMLSLLALLLTRLLPVSAVQRGASLLLRYIGLLFVPVCIGAVRQLPLLRAHGWTFGALIVAGALVGQATAGLLAQALCRKPVDSPAPEGFDA